MKPLNATTRQVLAPYWPGGRHGRLLCGEKAQNSWREGVCILGYAKFLVTGMQLDRSRKIGANAFAYPFAYPKLGVCMFFSAYRDGLRL